MSSQRSANLVIASVVVAVIASAVIAPYWERGKAVVTGWAHTAKGWLSGPRVSREREENETEITLTPSGAVFIDGKPFLVAGEGPTEITVSRGVSYQKTIPLTYNSIQTGAIAEQ